MTATNWHGYIYLPKAPAITNQEWSRIRAAIREAMESRAPVTRSELKFRERLSLSGNAVIYCVSVPTKVVSAAGRHALAVLIQQEIPRLTVQQVEDYLEANMDVFGGPGTSWQESAEAARATINQSIEEWQHEATNP